MDANSQMSLLSNFSIWLGAILLSRLFMATASLKCYQRSSTRRQCSQISYSTCSITVLCKSKVYSLSAVSSRITRPSSSLPIELIQTVTAQMNVQSLSWQAKRTQRIDRYSQLPARQLSACLAIGHPLLSTLSNRKMCSTCSRSSLWKLRAANALSLGLTCLRVHPASSVEAATQKCLLN